MLETVTITTPNRRILVVDDQPETAKLVRQWFSGQPYDIFEASDGQEGVRRAAADNPDLILIDLKMPVMDGLTAARKLKSDPATKSIPIILLTASKAISDKVEAFAAGADDYVTKPFDFHEVDARIRAMLRKRELYATLESTIETLKSTNTQLEELLVVDEKTGLYNFRQFQRKLKEEWLRAERYGTTLSLAMLDLDDFKKVNDSYGHPAGDRVLQEFATLVAGGARATDLAARYGGEEFAIILPHTGGVMASRVADRIRLAVTAFRFGLPEHSIRITASIGISTFPSVPDITTASALILAADRALYRAKKSGKDCVILDDGSAPEGYVAASRHSFE
jgi:diguanylate cyclase (GGDEF)-like protein